ncbi:MAG: hypothetical protein RIF33_17855 [Cyclobacteriaceae bacterium]
MKQFSRQEANEVKLFFASFGKRDNIILDLIVGILGVIGHYTAMIVEVFFRKRFGERYFTLGTVFWVFLILFLIANNPRILMVLPISFMPPADFDYPLMIFAFAFLVRGVMQRLEISKYGSTYRLDRFSLSQGEFLPFFYERMNTKLVGIEVNSRTIQILFEPVVPIILGIVLVQIDFTFMLGTILLITGLTMMARQFARVQGGREAVLDIIDQRLVAMDKASILLDRKSGSETHGITLPVALPDDEEVRSILMEGTSSQRLSKESWTDDK